MRKASHSGPRWFGACLGLGLFSRIRGSRIRGPRTRGPRTRGPRTRGPRTRGPLVRGGFVLGTLVLATACTVQEAPPEPEAANSPTPELPSQGESLLGAQLVPPTLPDEVRTQRVQELLAARQAAMADPDSLDAQIWVGRRMAYLGEYNKAIEHYTRTLKKHPDEPRLLRHRGHRWISVRNFPGAIADLTLAAEWVEGQPDRVEEDGLPNKRGIPTSTLHSNIWYHLALAEYLSGSFETAQDSYHACLHVSNNPDMLAATTHWAYMTLRRLGKHEEAAEMLEPIIEGMDIIENGDYYELLLMYKGVRSLEDLEARFREGNDVGSASLGYGIGNWHLYNGQPVEAERWFREVVSGAQWAAFGYIAAESELARGVN